MSRFLKCTLIAVAGLGLLTGGCLWALPEIVRRVALDQIPKRTGRAVAIADIDLNLFTGRFAVKGFRLADRESFEPFAEFERLDIQLSPLALLRSRVDLVDVVLTAPSLRIVRTGPTEFNFSDLLGGGKAQPPAAPSRWTLTIERLRISRGRVQMADRGVTPPAEWLVQDFGFQSTGLTTRPDAPPGQLTLRLQINQASLAVTAESLRLEPLQFRARLTVDGFETRWMHPYVYGSSSPPYRRKGGRLDVALAADVDSEGGQIRKAALSGVLTLDGEAFVQAGRPDPFLSMSRVGAKIKEADLLARTLTLSDVAIEGLDFKVRRDVRGIVDLLEMFTPKASPPSAATKEGASTARTAPSSPIVQPAPQRKFFPIIQGLLRGFEEIRVERITLAPSTVILVDEGVTPTTRLALTKLQGHIDNFTWPVRGPATVAVSTALPGGGTLEAKGPVAVQPFDADLTIAIRNAPVEPYQAYIPIPARLSGRFNGDSRNRLAFRDGRLVATSKGNSWAQNVEIREPGVTRPAIRVERMDLVGIDFDWPTRAAVVKAGFRRPRIEIERDANGSINLRRLFTAPAREGATPRRSRLRSPTVRAPGRRQRACSRRCTSTFARFGSKMA